MASKFCSRCGNKIPRKYKTPQGTIRKTPQSRHICYNCSPDVYVVKASLDNKLERHRRKEALVKMLGGKCKKCGYKKSTAALSFHHIDPSKKSFDISHNGNLLGDWESIVIEAKKCELLCLNCHAERHNSYDLK